MKQMIYIIFLLLSASQVSFSHEQGVGDTTGAAETICITSDFSVNIEYPNFWVSVLAHLAGFHTDSLKFVEWDNRTPLPCSFLLHLTDNDKHRWFEIASDSAFPSFVRLPLEDLTVLAPSALMFFSRALQFFRTTGTDTLHAIFEFGSDTLCAYVFHLSGSIDSNRLVTTLSHIETWNKRTGEEYNSADVTAVTQEGYTAFRNIKIFLKKKEITFQLTAVRVTVVRSKY